MSDERFWSRVDRSGGPDACWPFTGAVQSSGYGNAWHAGRNWLAHRLAWTLTIGDIPDGMVIDHLCGNRRCANPHHAQRTSHRHNGLRGAGPAALNVAKSHCPSGHPYDRSNTYVHRETRRGCRICRRAANRRAYARRTATVTTDPSTARTP